MNTFKNIETVLPPYTLYPVPSSYSDQNTDQPNWGYIALGMDKIEIQDQGSNALIVIADTMGQITHEDIFDPSLVIKTLCKNYTTEESPLDGNGHGTACMSIAASLSNKKGTIGYAPAAYRAACKVLTSAGSGDLNWIDEMCKDLSNKNVVVNANGKPLRKILSMSLGAYVPSNYNPLQSAIEQLLADDWIILCAAGNNGGKIGYPGSMPEVITVASLNQKLERSSFSSIGHQLDVAMPGEYIYSAWKDGYTHWSGTSAATPAAAGCVARIMSHFYDELKNQDDLMRFMDGRYIDLGAKGPDEYTGKGYYDMTKAFVKEPVDPGEPVNGQTIICDIKVSHAMSSRQQSIDSEAKQTGVGFHKLLYAQATIIAPDNDIVLHVKEARSDLFAALKTTSLNRAKYKDYQDFVSDLLLRLNEMANSDESTGYQFERVQVEFQGFATFFAQNSKNEA